MRWSREYASSFVRQARSCSTASSVPVAYAAFPHEIISPPREWVEAHYAIERWTEMPRGGHFAALEEPDRLIEDVRAFFTR